MKLSTITAKRLLVGAALLAALSTAPASAQPEQRWVYKQVPACRISGTTIVTTNLATCRRFNLPIFYVWIWTWVK